MLAWFSDLILEHVRHGNNPEGSHHHITVIPSSPQLLT